jgi:hypothetical protein
MTLAGAALLYLHAVPRRNVGGLHVFGPLLIQTSDKPTQSTLDDLGKQVDRSAKFSRLGFGLLTLGTLFQLLGVL